ncbi:MAG: type II toxin-antitoxin system VapC family toxin [Clostridiales bacterium]|nr:type II toxin-antitoxin system VapC family toxin [Clostridiales bacterium]
MIYFLDTNICIFYLNGTSLPVRQKIDSTDLEKIKIPSIVAAELYYGASKSKRREHNLARYEEFMSIFQIVHFDKAASRAYGDIRACLERKGEIIGGNDLLIAACALSSDAILVTNNTEEFSRIEKLAIEDWVGECD